MPKIFVLSGPDVGMSFDVHAGSVLGRAEDCAVALHDASVSRQHARLECEANVWTVVDMKSRNGLFDEGERVDAVVLGDGVEFRLGEVLLRFRTETAAKAAVAAAPVVRAPAQVSDEIVLEGEWDETVAASAAPRLVAQPAEVVARAESGPSIAKLQATARLARAGALPKGNAAGSRGVLQFSKIDSERKGFMGADLDQQPLWIKAAIGVVVLVVCAGIAWFAYRGVLMLKRGAHETAAVEDGTDEAR